MILCKWAVGAVMLVLLSADITIRNIVMDVRHVRCRKHRTVIPLPRHKK